MPARWSPRRRAATEGSRSLGVHVNLKAPRFLVETGGAIPPTLWSSPGVPWAGGQARRTSEVLEKAAVSYAVSDCVPKLFLFPATLHASFWSLGHFNLHAQCKSEARNEREESAECRERAGGGALGRPSAAGQAAGQRRRQAGRSG